MSRPEGQPLFLDDVLGRMQELHAAIPDPSKPFLLDGTSGISQLRSTRMVGDENQPVQLAARVSFNDFALFPGLEAVHDFARNKEISVRSITIVASSQSRADVAGKEQRKLKVVISGQPLGEPKGDRQTEYDSDSIDFGESAVVIADLLLGEVVKQVTVQKNLGQQSPDTVLVPVNDLEHRVIQSSGIEGVVVAVLPQVIANIFVRRRELDVSGNHLGITRFEAPDSAALMRWQSWKRNHHSKAIEAFDDISMSTVATQASDLLRADLEELEIRENPLVDYITRRGKEVFLNLQIDPYRTHEWNVGRRNGLLVYGKKRTKETYIDIMRTSLQGMRLGLLTGDTFDGLDKVYDSAFQDFGMQVSTTFPGREGIPFGFGENNPDNIGVGQAIFIFDPDPDCSKVGDRLGAMIILEAFSKKDVYLTEVPIVLATAVSARKEVGALVTFDLHGTRSKKLTSGKRRFGQQGSRMEQALRGLAYETSLAYPVYKLLNVDIAVEENIS